MKRQTLPQLPKFPDLKLPELPKMPAMPDLTKLADPSTLMTKFGRVADSAQDQISKFVPSAIGTIFS